MMRRTAGWRRLATLMAVVALFASACGEDSADPDQTSTTEPGDPPATAEDVTGTIDYWVYFAAEIEQQGLEEAIASFKDQHPEADVQTESIPLGDYLAKVTAGVQANVLPDAAQVLVGATEDWVQMGALVDLTERVLAWDGYDDIPAALWDEATVDGKIYGIPQFSFVGWMYYRADWFEELGLEPPTTWEEFEEAAIALTDPAQGRYGYGMRGGVGGDVNLIGLIESFGGIIVDEEGQPALDREILIEALEFYSRLHTEHGAVPPSVAEDSFGQLMAAFKTGQTGMLFHHTGSFVEISDVLEPGVEYRTAPLPSGPGGSASRAFAALNGITSEDNIETAWAWLTHWGSPDTQLAFRETVGQFPTRLEAANHPLIVDDPIYSTAAEIFTDAPAPTSFVGLRAWGANHLLPAYQRILVGTSTVEQAADDILEGLQRETS